MVPDPLLAVWSTSLTAPAKLHRGLALLLADGLADARSWIGWKGWLLRSLRLAEELADVPTIRKRSWVGKALAEPLEISPGVAWGSSGRRLLWWAGRCAGRWTHAMADHFCLAA